MQGLESCNQPGVVKGSLGADGDERVYVFVVWNNDYLVSAVQVDKLSPDFASNLYHSPTKVLTQLDSEGLASHREVVTGSYVCIIEYLGYSGDIVNAFFPDIIHRDVKVLLGHG